jgi:catechol 2,3-dioxygenase-like lactoylglutathione lyase family enzyme
MLVEPRVTLLTLGVRDVARSRRFYVDALGWPAVLVADDIVMVQVDPGLVLSLWDLEAMREEVGTVGLVVGADGTVTLGPGSRGPVSRRPDGCGGPLSSGAWRPAGHRAR